MTNDPLRRTRLRLARQRPAPARVRARVREEPSTSSPEQPEPERDRFPSRVRHAWQRVRTVRWADTLTVTATVLGALAALGGLIFTGVATFYSAAVSEDQLKQSQEDADLAIRRQALRVSIWVDDNGGAPVVHVMNGSPDPIYRVTVAFGLYPKGDLSFTDAYFLQVTIAPCTEVLYEEKRMGAGKRVFGKPMAFRDMGWRLEYVVFSDRDGRSWKRRETELHRWGPGDLGEGFPDVTYDGSPQIKGVDVCGEN